VLGGSNGPENIVIACPHCNQSKNAKHPMDFCGRLL
jgi:5-methylcytosine-specific restriction endonuclease McrA